MIIKLKDDYLIELNNIKIVNINKDLDIPRIKISYFEKSKIEDIYINCKNEEECILLIDKLIQLIQNSRKPARII